MHLEKQQIATFDKWVQERYGEGFQLGLMTPRAVLNGKVVWIDMGVQNNAYVGCSDKEFLSELSDNWEMHLVSLLAKDMEQDELS